MVVSWVLVQDNSADVPRIWYRHHPLPAPQLPPECAKWCWCDNAIVVKSAANVPRLPWLPWSTLITIYKHLQTTNISNIAANNINENRILKFCFTGHLSILVYLAHKLKLNLVQKYFLFFPQTCGWEDEIILFLPRLPASAAATVYLFIFTCCCYNLMFADGTKIILGSK